MKNYLEKVKNTVYAINEKGEMKQNVRNLFRSETQHALGEMLKVNGLEVLETSEGLGIRFENGEEGEIIGIVKLTIKDLGFDLDGANVVHLREVADKKAKAEKAETDKLAKIAIQETEKKAKVTK